MRAPGTEPSPASAPAAGRSPDPLVAIRSLTGRRILPLDGGWRLASVDPGAEPAVHEWRDVGPERTVAGALRRLGHDVLADGGLRLDARDHWFARDVATPPPGNGERVLVRLDGIATIAEVRWNGVIVAESHSMFSALTIDVTHDVRASNLLEIRCRSLEGFLDAIRAPRARWRTKLVLDQRLRAVRTSMLGRIPTWAPPAPVIGAWRPVRLVIDASRVTRCDATRDPVADALTVRLEARDALLGATCRVGDVVAPLTVSPCGRYAWATIPTDGLARWWPHTHGTPVTHAVTVEAHHGDGEVSVVDLGHVGVRTITVDRDTDGQGFGLVVNGVPVFCRGGSLMPIDPVSPDDDPEALRRRLEVLREAGLNMVRLSGVALPASVTLLDLCDELGILVWHDLMLANLDHPAMPELIESIEAEAADLLDRAALHACLAVVCGGSEIEQQAAMAGIAADTTRSLPLVDAGTAAVEAARPDLAVVRTSPTGGHVAFSNDHGVAHYFGVGAYRRPVADARHAGIRFASECLALANVPGPDVVARILGDTGTAPTDPRWKARVPRDRGTGWDFDDVRDHYARMLFGVDPTELRWVDPDRYLAVGRATSAELVARVMAEWRRDASPCRGALVWFLNDLWDGAGWGVLDAGGRPKAALHGLARSCAPRAVLLSDEGLNGLDVWCCNDTADAVDAGLELVALRQGATEVARAERQLRLEARSQIRLRADELFGRFTDPTRAYGFGPPSHDAIVARLVDAQGTGISHATFVPEGEALRCDDLGLSGALRWEGTRLVLRLAAARLARFVAIDAGAWTAWPDHVDVAPGMPRELELRAPRDGAAAPRDVYASALNGSGELRLRVPEPPGERR